MSEYITTLRVEWDGGRKISDVPIDACGVLTSKLESR
jgi:hypothetical protein